MGCLTPPLPPPPSSPSDLLQPIKYRTTDTNARSSCVVNSTRHNSTHSLTHASTRLSSPESDTHPSSTFSLPLCIFPLSHFVSICASLFASNPLFTLFNSHHLTSPPRSLPPIPAPCLSTPLHPIPPLHPSISAARSSRIHYPIILSHPPHPSTVLCPLSTPHPPLSQVSLPHHTPIAYSIALRH